jgi:DMSO/TMAO reductase YedYZ heme-binding membrane subunit
VIHYYWLVKSAVLRPLTYAAILAVLLLWRLATKYWPQPRPATVELPPKPQRAQA